VRIELFETGSAQTVAATGTQLAAGGCAKAVSILVINVFASSRSEAWRYNRRANCEVPGRNVSPPEMPERAVNGRTGKGGLKTEPISQPPRSVHARDLGNGVGAAEVEVEAYVVSQDPGYRVDYRILACRGGWSAAHGCGVVVNTVGPSEIVLGVRSVQLR